MRCLLFISLTFCTLINQAALESSPIRFQDVTVEAGLVEPLAGMMGHGGAWGDFDGDGKIDLFVGGFCDRPTAEYAPAKGPVPNRLFRNLGDGRFESAGQTAVESFGRTSGAVFADLDNNGTLELYVANNAQRQSRRSDEPQRSAQLQRSQLFRNDAGRLTDISTASGACPPELHTARNIGVFDFDGDGLLDLFVVEDKFARGGTGPRSVLLRNRGGLKFTDSTQAARMPDDLFGLGWAAADLNGDGQADFFVGHSNRLFLSQPDHTYREAAALRELFAHHPLNGEDWPCGVAFGDLNRDGRLDLVVTAHYQSARNRVFLNDGLENGVPVFRDVTKESGLGEPVPVKCPHVEIQDFDNDGWPDIYISAAWLEKGEITPLVFRNNGLRGGVPRFVLPRPIQEPMVYFPAGPTGDYDNDGRLDLFLVNWFAENHSRLLHNESPPRNWLQVRVSGRKMNRMGIGSQIRVFRSGQLGKPPLLGFQELTVGFGYASGQPAVCHFGLGDESAVDLEATLSNGARITRTGVKANQVLNLVEP